MSKCPYCQSDMETGFIEADQRGGVVWYKGTEKRTILDYTPLFFLCLFPLCQRNILCTKTVDFHTCTSN